MEQSGLKLRGVLEYSVEESGLSKLVFDGSSVTLHHSNRPFRIENLELRQDTYISEMQVSETEYDRLVCPVYMIRGTFVPEQAGFIRGVIRPYVSRNLHRIVRNIPPEFHFYMAEFEAYEAGVSLEMRNGILNAGVIESRPIDVTHEIGPGFTVKLPPDFLLVQFQK